MSVSEKGQAMTANRLRDGAVVFFTRTGDWSEAIDAIDWIEGEILAIGTSPGGAVARVFLGSHGSKILRHSPVPVLVLPG